MPAPEDGVPGQDEGRASAVVMVGNAGPELWRRFAAHAENGANALNDWSRNIIAPIAERHAACAVYPFDKPPLPFLRWAMKAEPVAPSPLGMLIHPEYGLWHAYRAALIFDRPIALPAREERARPCDSCPDKPCLATCPVGAFTEAGYDVPACAGHLSSAAGVACMDAGCLARAACPVGRPYAREQARFHMRAFHRAVSASA